MITGDYHLKYNTQKMVLFLFFFFLRSCRSVYTVIPLPLRSVGWVRLSGTRDSWCTHARAAGGVTGPRESKEEEGLGFMV